MTEWGASRFSLLNLIYRTNKAGHRSEDIAKKTVQFFKPEAIFQAKKLLWSLASVLTRVTERHNHQDNVLDLIRVLRSCDEKILSLPRFAIFKPDEGPKLSDEVTLPSRGICRTLKRKTKQKFSPIL